MAATEHPLLEDPRQLERSAGFTIEAQPEEEVYLRRSHARRLPADVPHGIYPKW